MTLTHHLDLKPDHLHGWFDKQLPPILHIDSGDIVIYRTPNAGWDDNAPDGYSGHDPLWRPIGAAHALVGPIWINDAEPGDVLEIRIRELTPAEWGIVVHTPGDRVVTEQDWGYMPDQPGVSIINGILANQPDDVKGTYFKHIFLDRTQNVWKFNSRISIPSIPFMGIFATSPDTTGHIPTLTPGLYGGNLDCKELVAGSTLFLPIFVPGALFSVGDGHGAQGDGEIDGAAIEAGMDRLVLEFHLHKNKSLKSPYAETSTHIIMLAFHEDLDVAALEASRNAMHYLCEHYDLSWDEAYNLASLAVDLRITQVVDGLKGVHAMIPKRIFEDQLTPERFWGTWKLVKFEIQHPDQHISQPWGTAIDGRLTYTSDGYVSVQQMRSDRPIFANPDPTPWTGTPDEIQAAFNGYLAYAGHYTLDIANNTIEHHIDCSQLPNWVNTTLIRRYRFEKNHLMLSSLPTADKGTVSLTWEKLS